MRLSADGNRPTSKRSPPPSALPLRPWSASGSSNGWERSGLRDPTSAASASWPRRTDNIERLAVSQPPTPGTGGEERRARLDDTPGLEVPARGAVDGYAPILETALKFLEPAQWTSYSDLAAMASTNAQTVGSYMGSTDTEGAHRVLQKSGTVSPGFTWNDGRTDDVRDWQLDVEGWVLQSPIASRLR